MSWIEVKGSGFVRADSGRPFLVWGVNYDRDDGGRLLEDYWEREWTTVREDFQEMKSLGANVVRIHLQLGRFMESVDDTSSAALARLWDLVALAETTGLYLDITGLGCYHKADIPAWYDALEESERWAVQARFWEAIAKTCQSSPAVFCYDLMNEPVLPGNRQVRTDWLAGEFAGKHFVQFLSLDLKDRTRTEVAKQWVDGMVEAIRRHDKRHLITVGVIPWALTFPGAKPVFYDPDVGERLDFVSVHFYPQSGKVDKALTALSAYDVGKPLVIEEMFPLKCSVPELEAFIDGSRSLADGWIGFYWGRTRAEYAAGNADIKNALMMGWLDFFKEKGPKILRDDP